MAWTRAGGVLASSPRARWGQAVRALPTADAVQIATSDYLFGPGALDVTVSFAGERGLVEIFEPSTGRSVAAAPLSRSDGRQLHEEMVRLLVPGPRVSRLGLRVTIPGRCACEVANLAFGVDYGFEVLDLTDTLNTFDTHVSSFDAHPNARAHQVMADVAYAALVGSP